MTKELRWGIVGYGRFGKVHAAAIQSLAGSALGAVCNRNVERLVEAKSLVPNVVRYEHSDDLLQDRSIDIVSITTHWMDHFDVATAALQSGKHVFLEKPMAATAEQCRQLCELAAISPGKLMVGHICRFDPRAVLAQNAVAQGRLGRILSMHAKRNLPLAPGHIRLDRISPLMGDGIHDADLMMWLLGRLPSRVYAKQIHTGRFRYPDLGWAMLEFEAECVGVIETNWALPENVPTVIDATLEVVGTEGKLTVDCAHTGFHLICDGENAMRDTVYWPNVQGRMTGALVDQLSYFADCVRQDKSVEVGTPEAGAAAVAVMSAAEQSAAYGIPIEVSPVHGSAGQTSRK